MWQTHSETIQKGTEQTAIKIRANIQAKTNNKDKIYIYMIKISKKKKILKKNRGSNHSIFFIFPPTGFIWVIYLKYVEEVDMQLINNKTNLEVAHPELYT